MLLCENISSPNTHFHSVHSLILPFPIKLAVLSNHYDSSDSYDLSNFIYYLLLSRSIELYLLPTSILPPRYLKDPKNIVLESFVRKVSRVRTYMQPNRRSERRTSREKSVRLIFFLSLHWNIIINEVSIFVLPKVSPTIGKPFTSIFGAENSRPHTTLAIICGNKLICRDGFER